MKFRNHRPTAFLIIKRSQTEFQQWIQTSPRNRLAFEVIDWLIDLLVNLWRRNSAGHGFPTKDHIQTAMEVTEKTNEERKLLCFAFLDYEEASDSVVNLWHAECDSRVNVWDNYCRIPKDISREHSDHSIIWKQWNSAATTTKQSRRVILYLLSCLMRAYKMSLKSFTGETWGSKHERIRVPE